MKRKRFPAVVDAAFPRKDRVSGPMLYQSIGHPE
jgi:hypothetical protein